MRDTVMDDERRMWLELVWVFRIMAGVSLLMSGLNLVNGTLEPVLPTLCFGAACFGSVSLLRRRPEWRGALVIALEIALVALFTFYVVSGEPEGFSALWICLTPAAAQLLLGHRAGGVLCGGIFAMLAFLLWTPWGQSLLQYEYTRTFLQRFPLLFLTAFAISWFLEYVRALTQERLLEMQRSYQHLYRHDALTGVMNRHGFNEHIGRTAEELHPRGLALMILDLDDFKRINDHYGHPAGDAVLCQTAKTLRETLGEKGEVSRWGGEEFAVLLHEAQDAPEIAQRLRRAVAQARTVADGQSIRATVSVGLTVCAGGAPIDAERLVTLTDQCLYRAKKNGKDQVAWTDYSPPTGE